ncbi:MAG: phosphoglycerate kinase, partial [bacterium]|nr:phosphoglycerate kinase [bacterium]
WSEEIKNAAFVVWNGTVGMYEKKEYAVGTEAVAQALVDSHCRAVLGGGDTLAALGRSDLGSPGLRSDLEKSGRIFFSTGGGAMLQFLADGTLVGIEAIKK